MFKHLILNLTVILETFSYMIKAYSWRNINQQAKEPDISNKRKKNGRIRSVPSLSGLPFNVLGYLVKILTVHLLMILLWH